MDDLYRGVDVLVATPGRLLDLMNQKHISLANVEHFVLDEADRMLDMGFIRDIRKVLAKLPSQRQNLSLSATMPKSIVELASGFLHDPVRVEVHPQSSAVDTIDQKVMFVDRPNKKHLLVSLLKDPSLYSVVLFSNETRCRSARTDSEQERHQRGSDPWQQVAGGKAAGARGL